jgi:hypothetical protein
MAIYKPFEPLFKDELTVVSSLAGGLNLSFHTPLGQLSICNSIAQLLGPGLIVS